MSSYFDINKFTRELEYQLNVFDLKNAAGSCKDFINFLLKSDDQVDLNKAERILQQLRNNRMFVQMQKVADALIQTNRATYKIQRQYVQALIDLGNYSAAIAVLQQLISNTGNKLNDAVATFENSEAKGLLGRVFKQLYINVNNPANQQSVRFITSSITAYYDVYKNDNSKVWHGINVVAMIERAKRDNIQIADLPDCAKLAADILNEIEKRYDNDKKDAWDFAIAAEACVAINKPEEALKWLSGYARMSSSDAFQLASTLRQFEEVWQLDLNTHTGRLLLPILRAELVKRSGSNLIVNVEEIKKQQAIENIITSNYKPLLGKTSDTDNTSFKLEKVFGDDSFKTYKWYMLGAARCLAVARIGKDSSKGFGTGFLIKSKELKDSWEDGLVVITNAHVVSDDVNEDALRSHEAIVIFEALDINEEFKNLQIIWSSPSTQLDATILKFDAADQQRLNDLTKSIKLYPISNYLPEIDTPPTQKIYVIGHPYGGTLQVSFLDNLLLDYADPKIHYRTPTDGGSSGSPVFNDQWDLIGLHHAGSAQMLCLNGKPGTYEANEGIWIKSIRNALP